MGRNPDDIEVGLYNDPHDSRYVQRGDNKWYLDIMPGDWKHVEKMNPKHILAMKEGKAPLEYLISTCDEGDARVLRGGADEYGICNWRIDKILASTYVGALRRHLKAWTEGQDIDPKSGEHHFHHIRANCAIVLDAMKQETFIDDRDKAESKDKENG